MAAKDSFRHNSNNKQKKMMNMQSSLDRSRSNYAGTQQLNNQTSQMSKSREFYGGGTIESMDMGNTGRYKNNDFNDYPDKTIQSINLQGNQFF